MAPQTSELINVARNAMLLRMTILTTQVSLSDQRSDLCNSLHLFSQRYDSKIEDSLLQ